MDAASLHQFANLTTKELAVEVTFCHFDLIPSANVNKQRPEGIHCGSAV